MLHSLKSLDIRDVTFALVVAIPAAAARAIGLKRLSIAVSPTKLTDRTMRFAERRGLKWVAKLAANYQFQTVRYNDG